MKCFRCDKNEMLHNSELCAECEAKDQTKIRGVLIFPAIGLILSIGIYAYYLFDAASLWISLRATNAAIIFLFVSCLILFSLSSYTAKQFFTYKKNLPVLFITLLIIKFIINLLDVLLGYFIYQIIISPVHIKVLIGSFISCCIWIPYFLISNRVKCTFTQ